MQRCFRPTKKAFKPCLQRTAIHNLGSCVRSRIVKVIMVSTRAQSGQGKGASTPSVQVPPKKSAMKSRKNSPKEQSSEFDPAHPGTKTKITVREPTLKATERVVKRQKGSSKRIRELSRLLLHIVDQVQDLEEAASKADIVEREKESSSRRHW